MNKYHIVQLDESYYKVSWEGRVNGQKLTVVGRFTYEGMKLSVLLSQARNRIGAGVFAESKKKGFKPIFTSKNLEWDGDSSNLPNVFQRQAVGDVAPQMVAGSLNELTHVMAQKKDPERVFEIKKVNNVWTVVKHDTPLLTWEEAANLLKTKVN